MHYDTLQKLRTLILLVVSLWLLNPASLAALVKLDSVCVEVDFTEPRILPSQYSPNYIHIEMDGMPSLGIAGEPVLPVKGLKLLIPYGKEVEKVQEN